MDSTAAVMILYFLAMIFIGTYSARYARAMDDFHLAGRSVRGLILTATLTATIIGASATIGMSGMGFKEGLTGSWWMLSGTAGLLVLAAFFASRIRASGCSTLPELIGTFYDQRARTAASLLILTSWIGVISVQIMASGKILGALFGHEVLFMAVAAIVFIAYTVQGGQHSVIRTDLLQMAIILAGLILLFTRSLGHDGLALLAGQSFPTSPARDGFGVASLVAVVGSVYLVGPDIYSRIFLARDPGTARRSVATAAVLLIPMAFVITSLGIFARSHFPGIVPEQALPTLMMNLLSPVERGIVGAALISAFMSSAATPLMTATTTMALDLYRKALPESDCQHLMKASRIGTLIIGMSALILAIASPGIISTLLAVYTIFTGGMLIPVVAGFYREQLGLTPAGALAAMVGGGAAALICGQSFPLAGMCASALLLLLVSVLDRSIKRGSS
ncbi:MAG TPA: sodium:solute symporter family protein [Methanotrichaceae archaeon]|nr:sodium:solute symporter family protein [Methanotrichaceae archaeon]